VEGDVSMGVNASVGMSVDEGVFVVVSMDLGFDG
jgi:hypothetical protein